MILKVGFILGRLFFNIPGFVEPFDLSINLFPEKTLIVSPAYTNCKPPFYTSIQSAINDAVPGTLILVFPATYIERLTLKNNVNLYLHEGVSINQPATGTTAIITADNVNCIIDGFGTVTASSDTYPLFLVKGGSKVIAKFKKLTMNDDDAVAVKDSGTRMELYIEECTNAVSCYAGELIVHGNKVYSLYTPIGSTGKLTAWVEQITNNIECHGGTLKAWFSRLTGNAANIVNVDAGYCELNGGSIETVSMPNNNTAPVYISGGKLRLKECFIKIGAVGCCVYINDTSDPTTILEHCTLVTGGGYSVNGDPGMSLFLMNTYANTQINTINITNQIDSMNVNIYVQ